jgi:hypothetical protein
VLRVLEFSSIMSMVNTDIYSIHFVELFLQSIVLIFESQDGFNLGDERGTNVMEQADKNGCLTTKN